MAPDLQAGIREKRIVLHILLKIQLDIFSKTKLGETKQGASAVKNLSEHKMNNEHSHFWVILPKRKNVGAPIAVIRSQMSLFDNGCIFVYGPQLLVSGNSSLVYG